MKLNGSLIFRAYRKPRLTPRPSVFSRRVQHILNEDTVALGGIFHQHAGNGADVLAVFEELKAFYPEYANGFLPQEHVTGWLPEIWPCHDMQTDTANDAIVLEFRYHRVVAADPANDQMLEPLFASFTVPGELTGDQLDRIKEMQIIVEGHAIQTATFETEDDAWAAFDDQETATTLVDPPVEEEQPPVVPAP